MRNSKLSKKIVSSVAAGALAVSMAVSSSAAHYRPPGVLCDGVLSAVSETTSIRVASCGPSCTSYSKVVNYRCGTCNAPVSETSSWVVHGTRH